MSADALLLRSAPLERRTPGATDLRVFTTEVIPRGRHRVRPGALRLREVRSMVAGPPLPARSDR